MNSVVAPMRFTTDWRAMIDFLTLVGLQVVQQRDGSYAELRGRGGIVAVHALATASSVTDLTTSFCLVVEDSKATAEDLVEQGHDARWWDEAWGRQASVRGPYGEFSINERIRDPYGYEIVQPAEGSVVDVVSAVYTPDLDVSTAFFGHLGYEPAPGAAPGWRPLRSGGASGVIGVHSADAASVYPNGWATTELGFETLEPLADLAARLRTAAHPVVDRTDDPDAPHLEVTDPDGLVLEIYPAREDVA